MRQGLKDLASFRFPLLQVCPPNRWRRWSQGLGAGGQVVGVSVELLEEDRRRHHLMRRRTREQLSANGSATMTWTKLLRATLNCHINLCIM